jgi:thymidylate synthase (FAD)
VQTRLKVILLTHTPNPEQVVAAAAKLCYSNTGVQELRKRIEEEDANKFVAGLLEMGHLSPVEHASFTFGVEGISRACSHQLVRHRLASYSQQSQRYVSKAKGFDYVIPPAIDDHKQLREYFVDYMNAAHAAYIHILEKLSERGIKGELANQDARFVLPNAAETKLVVTMNSRELLHFFRQRCCNRAQWEIRNMATEMLKLVQRIAPTIFAKAGPGCLSGACPEGTHSCGKANEVREYFARQLK